MRLQFCFEKEGCVPHARASKGQSGTKDTQGFHQSVVFITQFAVDENQSWFGQLVVPLDSTRLKDRPWTVLRALRGAVGVLPSIQSQR